MTQDTTMETPVSDGSVPKRSSRRKTVMQNYNENLMDELLEDHVGVCLKKKSRTQKDLEKETETEAMIALSLGFPIDELLEEEIRAGVVSELDGKEQNDYIVVRNHILATWRANVRIWLSKDRIRETVSNEYEHLMCAAYEFLYFNGYINFGVSPSFTFPVPEERPEGSVIIVGAGLAGLAAARQLMAFGFKVAILEGRNRAGGRVYTEKMGQSGQYSSVDLGGSIITGIHANPLGVLARQLSLLLHKVRDSCPLYKPNGAPVDTEVDFNIQNIFNKLLDKVTEFRKTMGEFAKDISLGSVLEILQGMYAVARTTDERQLLDWHFANLEYANAGLLSSLSAAYWDQDDPYEMGGDHCFLAGGNWGLIKALSEGLPILYGKTVDTIRYGDDGVEVVVGDQVYEADRILCTVPLGVLKKKSIRFEPELSERKLAAIERLGFGLLNKVAMVFPHVFWGEDLDTFGHLNEYSHQRGEFFLFYSYHTVAGGAVLVALVAGDAANCFESTDPSTSLHKVLSILRGIFGPKGIDVPDPIQSICTRWGSDPLSYGSYSHVRVGSSGIDYDIMAESVGDRLFFAGEATTRQYPATMHGAFLSGLREASCILQATRVQQNNPWKPTQKFTSPTNDTLIDLFKKPDLAFGIFSLVFDPLTEDPKSKGILSVTNGDPVNETCDGEGGCDVNVDETMQLYTVVSREQAHELQLVTGGNRKRVSFLTKDLGLKLMSLNTMALAYSSLITNIASARKGRGRNRLAAGHRYDS